MTFLRFTLSKFNCALRRNITDYHHHYPITRNLAQKVIKFTVWAETSLQIISIYTCTMAAMSVLCNNGVV